MPPVRKAMNRKKNTRNMLGLSTGYFQRYIPMRMGKTARKRPTGAKPSQNQNNGGNGFPAVKSTTSSQTESRKSRNENVRRNPDIDENTLFFIVYAERLS
jgi:hypothetical protein